MQTTLTGDPDDPDDVSSERATSDDTATTDTTASISDTLAPTDQRGGEGCCPWCLASAETFKHHEDGSVGCGHCDAAIPIGVDWYEQGEKIIL